MHGSLIALLGFYNLDTVNIKKSFHDTMTTSQEPAMRSVAVHAFEDVHE